MSDRAQAQPIDRVAKLVAERDAAQQEVQTLRKALVELVELVNAAVSTRAIVSDHLQLKRYGHNPSWVKAADVSAALAPRPQEPQ